MKTSSPNPDGLNAREVLEKAALKKIIKHYPEANRFKGLIKFVPNGNKLQLNLEMIDASLASKIRELFQ
ncbi:MAG: hypothetical protein QM726_18250 [Chitinophagaceae bacterium]